MAIDVTAPRSRRAVLGALIGGLAATAANAVGRPAAALATDGQPVIQGQTNTGSLSTVVAVANTTALQGVTDAPTGNNYGVRGRSTSTTGSGVVGQVTASTGQNYGVRGFASSGEGAGVRGEGPFYGVQGDATDDGLPGVGVRGHTAGNGAGVIGYVGAGYEYQQKTGVHGQSNDSGTFGVVGRSLHGTAVEGRTDDGIAVRAYTSTPAGTALKVDGTTRFSRSGKKNVLAGQSTALVTGIPLTSSSLVFATIQGTGAAGLYVRGVSVSITNSRFTIRLSQNVASNTPVAWFVVN